MAKTGRSMQGNLCIHNKLVTSEVLHLVVDFFYLVCEAIGTAATPGLLVQPQRHVCPSQSPTWPDPGLNPGRRSGKPATNRLSYGAGWSPTYDWLQLWLTGGKSIWSYVGHICFNSIF
jgi:hypothetical protein